MIYYLTLVFAILFFLPQPPLNWQERLYWWAQDNPFYWGWLKLEGPDLYYWALLTLYLAIVGTLVLALSGLPFLAHWVLACLPFQWAVGLAENLSRLSIDSWRWVRRPFEFRQAQLGWLWWLVDGVALAGLLYQGWIAASLGAILGYRLDLPPSALPLCAGWLIVGRLARLETGLFWQLNRRWRGEPAR